MDLYGHRLSGAELVEAALSHNLDREVHEVERFCNGELADIVDVWALRIDFNKAKAVPVSYTHLTLPTNREV